MKLAQCSSGLKTGEEKEERERGSEREGQKEREGERESVVGKSIDKFQFTRNMKAQYK